MKNSSPPSSSAPDAVTDSGPDGVIAQRRRAAESRVEEISSLLSALEEATTRAAERTAAPTPTFPAPPPATSSPPQDLQQPLSSPVPPATPAAPAPIAAGTPSTQQRQPAQTFEAQESRLVLGRLGLASSLFTTLRHRDGDAAAHSLRVALGCSSWALYKQFDDETRNVVEIAAMLHEVGSAALPDAALAQAAQGQPLEPHLMAARRTAAAEILASCQCPPRVIEAVRHADAAFAGDNGELRVTGDGIPLESRMIAVVDAFDQLTSGRLGEPLSRVGALARLSELAGERLDPILVAQFADVLEQSESALTEQVAARWLSHPQTFPWQVAESAPRGTTAKPAPAGPSAPSLFEQKLIDAMLDGVLFVDAQRRIFLWSKGAERLSGVSAGAALKRRFAPSLLDMCNTMGRRVADDNCPVARAMANNTQIRQRLQILGRSGQHVAINLHAIPVVGPDHEVIGATVLLQDAQPEASLEEKCDALYAEATQDLMTKVANRAEFDRMHIMFMEAHEQAGQPCSLIMADIDHFKNVNDTFGHQAGDEAIIMIAGLLKEMCRSGDMVARYGGEEFAVLCAHCSSADAARRADQIRRKLAETPLAFLGGKHLTASFGVTQIQDDDSPEAMLRRADQALYTAKNQGRNQVVQSGGDMEEKEAKRGWWGLGSLRVKPVIETKLSTGVPKNIAVEKLAGFVTDVQARIVSNKGDHVELEISSEKVGKNRRTGDRSMAFRVELDFAEHRRERTNGVGLAKGSYLETVISVSIRPKRGRNRRQVETADRARLVLQSLKGYLMAKEAHEEAPGEPALA
ncbi:MAG: diguanylate cyclase [Planctomycetales bacterium]|nr:diguanylate cyclase [Planctomycetales bacterium]